MEILDLRHFSSADLRPLLEREAQAWARLLSWDYRSSAEMILRYLDARILPGYAAVNDGRVFGYSFFVYEGSKGVIGDLFVAAADNGRRQRGNGRGKHGNGGAGNGNHYAVEQRLLTHVIETLQLSPGIHRIEAQLLVHETDAVAAPFLREGFQRHRRLFMMLPLERLGDAATLLPPGIELRSWSEPDYQAAAAVITAAYRNHIDSEINDQYRSVSGALRFLNNIVRFPGCGVFDPESSLVAVHRPSRGVVGLILCSRVRDDIGHVTQVCVLPEWGRKGIGEALLRAAAQRLLARRFTAMSLTVTEANRNAVELYRRLGFDLQRVFDAFVWES